MSRLTNNKLDSELVIVGLVGPVEGDLDLELPPAAHDERVAGGLASVVMLLVDLG